MELAFSYLKDIPKNSLILAREAISDFLVLRLNNKSNMAIVCDKLNRAYLMPDTFRYIGRKFFWIPFKDHTYLYIWHEIPYILCVENFLSKTERHQEVDGYLITPPSIIEPVKNWKLVNEVRVQNIYRVFADRGYI